VYSVCVRRRLTAEHFLTVPDAGDEGELHAHDYLLEVTVEGPSVGPHEYLIDIDELGDKVDAVVSDYQGQVLNELPAFAGSNPSLERFAFATCGRLSDDLADDMITSLTVRIWEDDLAWAAYSTEL